MTSVTIDRTDGLNSAAAIKGPCLAATTANITLAGEQTIDGVAVVTGDRVLVKDQTAGSENGVYVADTGPWRRAKDFNRTRDVVEGTLVHVTDGTANAGRIYKITTPDPISVGTTSIAFAEGFATAARSIIAGTGLTGGGDLSQDRTISLNAASIASLELADSAIQGADIIWPLDQLGAPTGSDWTAVINAALAAGKKILLPEGETGVTGITVVNGSVIIGAHRKNSVLRLLNSSNQHVISTASFDAKFGTSDTEVAPQGVALHNFTINGNRANNSSGCGIALYARRFSIVDVDLFNIPDDGIKCDYQDSASGPITPGDAGMLGMESEFRNIWMDYIGGHGMNMRGPHDSFLDNIHVIHASQKTANTYDAFHIESTFTARARNLHAYNSGTVNNHRWGIYDDAGLEVTDAHFEGSATGNVLLLKKGAKYKGVHAYATRNAAWNVLIAGNECSFHGFLGGKASGVDVTGIVLGRNTSPDFAQANIIDVIAVDQNAGTIDFTNSVGQNVIRIRGEQASGTKIIGNPHVSDAIDINIGGVFSRQVGWPEANNLAAGGTNASDATLLPSKANRVVSATGNFGVKLPSSLLFVGETITLINSTASTLKVYATGADAVEYPGNSFPSPFTLAAGKCAMFTPCFRGHWAAVVTA